MKNSIFQKLLFDYKKEIVSINEKTDLSFLFFVLIGLF